MNTQQIADVIINNVIEYRIKDVYGKENIYVTSEHAQAIYRLTGKKTIDHSDMKALESLGFVFNRVF